MAGFYYFIENMIPKCPYCHKFTVFTTNDKIYGKKFGTGMCYLCEECDAYVGCHEDGRPYGTPANKELRTARMNAHEHFDALWKSKKMKRAEAYKWLSDVMKLKPKKAHIGMFSLEQCKELLQHFLLISV